jgi:hypothetical protein
MSSRTCGRLRTCGGWLRWRALGLMDQKEGGFVPPFVSCSN